MNELAKGLTIGLVGLSGSGKSTLSDLLGEALGWPVIDVGKEYFRPALRQWGQEVQEGDEIPLWLDEQVDRQTAELLGKQVIVVGRVVTWLAREKIKTGKLAQNHYFGVGVFCSGEAIAQRARNNWNKKKNLAPETPLPTIDHVRRVLRLRNTNDMARFNSLYGIKSKAELYGMPPNDVLVDSDRMSPEQELALVLAELHGIRLLATS